LSDSFSHFDESGKARMVDLGEKQPTAGMAAAVVRMRPETHNESRPDQSLIIP
jgi:molybdenum cofactor biosynthesis enzyme